MPDLLPLIVVAGPTGSGKSELALAICERFGGEIVNYDSVQIYRGFDAGSAKLPVAARRGVPHHLIDIRDPGEVFTAGDFSREAVTALAGLKDRLPVLCGGTGFYLDALLNGLPAAAGRDETLRSRLLSKEARKPGTLHRLLGRLAPDRAEKIHRNDVNKTLRALEIRLTSGFIQGRSGGLEGFRVLRVGLNPARGELFPRLNARCEQMWPGVLAEVRDLLAAGVDESVKPLESLGYKQALRVVQNKADEQGALLEMQIRTRNYAKRQWTWFRSTPGVEWLNGFGIDERIQAEAISIVDLFLKTRNELESGS